MRFLFLFDLHACRSVAHCAINVHEIATKCPPLDINTIRVGLGALPLNVFAGEGIGDDGLPATLHFHDGMVVPIPSHFGIKHNGLALGLGPLIEETKLVHG
jgi:hypothetical protein